MFNCDTAPYIRKLLCAPQIDVRLSDAPVVFINSSWLRSLEISISHVLVFLTSAGSKCLPPVPPAPPGTLGQSFTPITGVRPWVTHTAVRPGVTHCSAADSLGQNYKSRMIISTQFSRVGFKMLIKSRQNRAQKEDGVIIINFHLLLSWAEWVDAVRKWEIQTFDAET